MDPTTQTEAAKSSGSATPYRSLDGWAPPEWLRKACVVPPRHLRKREWVEKHVEIRVGKRTGPLRLAANPMQGPLFDILEHPGVRETAIMKAVQTGLSTLLRASEAHEAHTDPCFSMLVLPSRESGRDQIKKYWGPMLRGRDCPVLKPLQRKRASRRRLVTQRESEEVDRSTYQNIVLSNGHDLLLGYSGSVQSLASHGCKRVKFDEVDKYNDWDGDEAEPIMLGRRRTETYQDDCRIDSISTPTTDLGQIYKLFEASDIKLFPFLRCPDCGEPVQLLFQNVEWDLPKDLQDRREQAALLRNEPHRVWLKCAVCNGKISEEQRKTLLHRGFFATLDQKWQFHADGREVGTKPPGTRVGIHFPQLASLMGSTMPTQASRWIEAQGSLKAIQDCRNNDHGLPFVFDQEKPAKGELLKRCRDDATTGFIAPKAGVVPTWASRLILTIDTQKTKFYWVLRAWGANFRSRLIAYGEALSFAELEELIYRKWWPNEDERLPSMRVWGCAIDSGGGMDGESEDANRTEQVYRWTMADPTKRMAIKGVRSKKYDTGQMTRKTRIPYVSTSGEELHVNLMWVQPLGSGDVLSSLQKQQLDVIDPETGEVTELKNFAWELNRNVGYDYIRHIEVMSRKRIKKKGGKYVDLWKEEADGARHDYFDCERYQVAIAYDFTLGCHGLPSEAQIRAMAAARAAEQKQSRVKGGIPLDVPRR